MWIAIKTVKFAGILTHFLCKQIEDFDSIFSTESVCVRADKKEKHREKNTTKKDLSQMIFTPYCSYFTIRKHDDLYQSNYACAAVKTNTW